MPTGTRPRPPTRSVRAVFSGTLGSSPWANVLWLRIGGSGEVDVTDLHSFGAFIGNAWGDNLIAHMSTLAIMNSWHVQLYSSDTDDLSTEGTLSIGGTVTGNNESANTAIAISWHILPSYRGGHPRSYLPGVPIAHLASERAILSEYASTLAAGAATFITNCNGYSNDTVPSVELGTMSFVRAKAWRTPPVFYAYINASVDTRLDSQRRRLGRDVSG